jgi:hypothetical protein
LRCHGTFTNSGFMSTNRRDAYLEPTSVVAVVIYSLLLASGLVAHGMGFPRFSTEPRATSSIAMDVPAPLASGDETIGYR